MTVQDSCPCLPSQPEQRAKYLPARSSQNQLEHLPKRQRGKDAIKQKAPINSEF